MDGFENTKQYVDINKLTEKGWYDFLNSSTGFFCKQNVLHRMATNNFDTFQRMLHRLEAAVSDAAFVEITARRDREGLTIFDIAQKYHPEYYVGTFSPASAQKRCYISA